MGTFEIVCESPLSRSLAMISSKEFYLLDICCITSQREEDENPNILSGLVSGGQVNVSSKSC
jgi:hypothetical protein